MLDQEDSAAVPLAQPRGRGEARLAPEQSKDAGGRRGRQDRCITGL